MGNCLKAASSSSMEWAGDDWGSLASEHNRTTPLSKVLDESQGHHYHSSYDVVSEKTQLLGALGASSDHNANGRVTIKISKKDLEDLLRGIQKQKQNNKNTIKKNKEEGGIRRVSAEQVLVRLLNARDHHRPWRPVLESIPEVN